MRFGSGFGTSVSDFAYSGSSLPLRSPARAGSALGARGVPRFDSSPTARGFGHWGSSLPGRILPPCLVLGRLGYLAGAAAALLVLAALSLGALACRRARRRLQTSARLARARRWSEVVAERGARFPRNAACRHRGRRGPRFVRLAAAPRPLGPGAVFAGACGVAGACGLWPALRVVWYALAYAEYAARVALYCARVSPYYAEYAVCVSLHRGLLVAVRVSWLPPVRRFVRGGRVVARVGLWLALRCPLRWVLSRLARGLLRHFSRLAG